MFNTIIVFKTIIHERVKYYSIRLYLDIIKSIE